MIVTAEQAATMAGEAIAKGEAFHAVPCIRDGAYCILDDGAVDVAAQALGYVLNNDTEYLSEEAITEYTEAWAALNARG